MSQQRIFSLWKNLSLNTKKYIKGGIGLTILSIGTYQFLKQSQINKQKQLLKNEKRLLSKSQSQQQKNTILLSSKKGIQQLKEQKQKEKEKAFNNQSSTQQKNIKDQKIQTNQKLNPQQKQSQQSQQQKQVKQQKEKIKVSSIIYKQNTKPFYQKMSQIQQFPIPNKNNNKREGQSQNQIQKNYQYQVQGPFLIIADLPYNQSYQKQLLTNVHKIRQTLTPQANKNLQIFKLDLQNQQNKKILSQKYKISFGDDLMFLLRNDYDSQLATINYNLYIQYPGLLKAYLSNLRFISKNLKEIHQMGSHQVFAVYLTDKKGQDQLTYKKRLITAKYLELEFLVKGLSQNAKIYIIDKEDAIQNNLIKEENAKANSIHLIRKKNVFTTEQANLWLQSILQLKPKSQSKQIQNNNNITQRTPLHILEDIPLYDRQGNITIPIFLNQIQTFSSTMITAPFVCSVFIDRNKISTDEYYHILSLFADLKRKNKFPMINYVLKVQKIPYTGNIKTKEFGNHNNNSYEQNDLWMIKITDVASLDKQTMAHQIKTLQDLKELGIQENTFQRSTFEYLYKSQQLNQEKISQFIKNSIEGKQQPFFRSQKKTYFKAFIKQQVKVLKKIQLKIIKIIQSLSIQIIVQHVRLWPL